MFDCGEACPISMATSVLCERWTLQIVRELLFGSSRYSRFQIEAFEASECSAHSQLPG